MGSPTHYYVSPGSGSDANSGTLASPWKTARHAVITISRDSTNGDQINVQEGTTSNEIGTLPISTYGSPTFDAPLYIRGYSTAANDGGRFALNFGINSAVSDSAIDNVAIMDGTFTNTSINGTFFRLDNNVRLVNVDFDVSSVVGHVLQLDSNTILDGCTFKDSGNTSSYAVYLLSNAVVDDCSFTTGKESAVYMNSLNGNFHNCEFNVSKASANALRFANVSNGGQVIGCTFYNSSAGTGAAIKVAGERQTIIKNNIIEGWNGTGGHGIEVDDATHIIHTNRFYECDTNIKTSVGTSMQFDNVSLAASPFTDAANGDFSIGDVTLLKGVGWPAKVGGDGGTSPTYRDIGAAQRQEGGGGGSSIFLMPGLRGGLT